jgi:thiosulfate dehydrogenase
MCRLAKRGILRRQMARIFGSLGLRNGAARTAALSIASILIAPAVIVISVVNDIGAADRPTVDLTTWKSSNIDSVGNDELGKLVRYGYALMIDTANQIGPTVADPAKRYSGNNLTCESCHLQAGTQPYAIPLVGVWGQFPQYRGREGNASCRSRAMR